MSEKSRVQPASAEADRTDSFKPAYRGLMVLVVMAEAVAPTVAVAKGDIVAIRCISGTVVLSTRARAMATGRDGELVQFQALDSKRTFFARMDGKGHATVVAGDAVPADSRRPVPARPAPTLQSRALEAVR